jgi:hypothetical protein
MGLHPAEQYTPSSPQGIAARSLIDEQSLPSWMRQGQAGDRSEDQELAGAGPSAKSSGGSPQGMQGTQAAQGMTAANLIEPAALPEWMKSLEPATLRGTAPPPTPAAPPAAAAPPQPPAGAPGQPLNARDLIDPQQLPDWLRGQVQPQSQSQGNAADLTVGGATRLNAASLLDMNALPAWLRDNQQEPAPAAQSAPWPPAGDPAAYPGRPQNPGAPAGSLTAASLIDMNALPEWLRSGVNLPSASEAPGRLPEPPRPAAEGLAQRMESMRVPSRPRNETGVNEQNEAAANVFASLLGVASVAPSLPSTPGADPRYGPVPSFQTQQITPAPPFPQSYAAPYPGANQPQVPVSPPYAAPASPLAAESGEQSPRQGGRPPRRSFLDVIRSWFPH